MVAAYVGVVRFNYLKTPKGTILDFLEFLADNNDEADWHLGTYTTSSWSTSCRT